MQTQATAPKSSAASHTLAIDGMTGDVCVQSVTGALKSVHGVNTQSVKVGSATITCDDAACTAACAAIGKAGFKAREASPSSNVKATDKSPKNDAPSADKDDDLPTDSNTTPQSGAKSSTNGQQDKGIAAATIQPNKTFPAPAKSH